MFNFIFDGKLGDMLAPIKSPIQQFHLAIQHHKHDDIQRFISSGTIEFGNVSDAGCADLHIAAKFNNMQVVEFLLSRGLSVDLKDNHGSTPLHYSAKYGHFDMCKYLIDHGASAAARNARGQSPYDVADGNHRVRQYLLPIQLQLERDQFSNTTQAPSYSQQNYYQHTSFNAPAAPVTHSSAHQFPPPPYLGTAAQDPIPPSPSPTARSDPSPVTLPTNPAAPPAPYPPPPTPSAEASVYQRNAPPTPGVSYASSSTSSRMIQADGFGSSASDPVLQKKYGHVKEQINIAPPPLAAGPGSYSMYANNTPAPTGIYSRYVPYDGNHYNNPPSQSLPPSSTHFSGYTSSTPPPPHIAAPSLPHSRSVPAMPSSDFGVPKAPASSGDMMGNISLFNPMTDKIEEVEATASSSSIL